MPYPPLNFQILNKATGLFTDVWQRYFAQLGPGGSGIAPGSAPYVTTASSPDLPNARVLSDSSSVKVSTAVPGAVELNLSTTGVGAATYGDSTHVSQVTVDTQGRITAAANVAIAAGGTVTHTGALAANNLVVGNGSADIKTSAATDGQIPIGKTSDGSVTLAAITPGSNITITPGPGTLTIGTTGGSGGTGNSTYTGASGSEPGGINAGDLYFENNGFYVERYSGSAWLQWGPIWPMTIATAPSSTWVNQGSAAVSSTNGALRLTCPAGGNADSMRFLVKTAPSTPYVITAAFLANGWYSDFMMFGLFFRESGSGKLIMCDVNFPSAGAASTKYEYVKFTNPTTFSAVGANPTRNVPLLGIIQWFQIADDGANRTFSVSDNGYDWDQIFQETRTTFLTADQVGWGINNYSNAHAYTMTLLSWKES